MATKREAVRGAQTLLQAEFPALKVDGVWGVGTDGSFVRASKPLQAATTQSLESQGFSLADVRGTRSDGQWITEAEARAISERAARRVNIDPDYLYYLLDFEPRRRIGLNGREYDVTALAPNRIFKGLFQMGPPAWKDARAIAPEIGAFEANWRDPYLNAVAAAAFSVRNAGYAKTIHRYTKPLSHAVLYAMHNQGHTFLSSARKGGIGRYADGQSQNAKELLARAAVEVRSAA